MTIPFITLKTGRMIGAGLPAYIIAEVGSNHEGNLSRAKMLIHAAKRAGADAVKFQSFQAENLINSKRKEGGFWENEPAFEVLQKMSLPVEWHEILANEAENAGLDFLSTPFDLERLSLLMKLDVPAIKIASGDLTYYELLCHAGKTGKPIFLSTGHALLGEVEAALRILWSAGCKQIVLLHATSLYPADYKDANIPAMTAMRDGFKVQVGYSDHTPGPVVSLGAVAHGACVIEKHLTDDKTRQGPDHPFALEEKEFLDMVTKIRQMESAFSGGLKTYVPEEEEERIMARRAVYAKQDIFKGTPITREMVKIVRHAYPEGVSADHWNFVSGRSVSRDVFADELICWDMI